MKENRDLILSSVIPKIKHLKIKQAISTEEKFQNEVLRPILKFQNDLFISLVLHHVEVLSKLDIQKMDHLVLRQKVQNQLSNNQKLRNQLLGMVLGLMTTVQLKIYFTNEQALRKRIFSMLTERILDGLQHRNID